MYWTTKALNGLQIGMTGECERREITNIVVRGNDVTISRPKSITRVSRYYNIVNCREVEYYNVSKKNMERLVLVINNIKDRDKSVTLYHDGFAVELNW